MGGPVPLGYEVRDKKLVIHLDEADQVRLIFERYVEFGCLTKLARSLREEGIRTKISRRRDGTLRGGIPFTKGPLAYLLRNRVYVGEVIHKGRYYPGVHDPVMPQALFDGVQQELDAKARNAGSHRIAGSLLTGRIFDDRGNRMTPTTTKKGGARYRYYTSCVLAQGRKEEAGSVTRVDELTTGSVTDTRQIARREGCSERSVRMTLNLAFLSPDIMRAAVEGRLPHGVGTTSLADTPPCWRAQTRDLIHQVGAASDS
ncbi:hypothetical protein CHELA1G11_10859 [Hyphomicrobiales bacterium]|nr:hypothetical protein CHELA1G11_10859 [Hyphomicrobiales bacterium]CAH1671809.1 hypothetical protein CHELA1G2_13449 [Hyphomicrobiales bacterium]